MNKQSLSLKEAILININIMLGVGLFINTTELAKRAHLFGAFGYPIISILMLPLVLSITQLLQHHPAGGFYIFGAKEIHPFIGFVSTWCYFIGKLASASIMIHTAVLLIQQLLPFTQGIPTLIVDCLIIALYIRLTTLHLQTNSAIQSLFMGMKIIPTLFVGLATLFLFKGAHITVNLADIILIPSTLPLVLFAIVGFEAACSLSSKIENARHNAPRAVLISYAIVTSISFLYQFCFYSMLGDTLATLGSYQLAFPALIEHLFKAGPYITQSLITMLHMLIATSALGGAYGIMFSNSWNLYTLAQHNHIIGSSWLQRLNRHGMPWLCIITEGIICIVYLNITQGNQIPLQQLNALGCVIAFTFCALSLLFLHAREKSPLFKRIIPALGLINCFALAINCFYSLTKSGSNTLTLFCILIVLGIGMFWYTWKKSKTA